MKKLLPALLAAALFLTGCEEENINAIPSEFETVCLFDYFMESMPSDKEHTFELSEFPGVTFKWDYMNLLAEENGETRSLYCGMPIWSVYLCDLNYDGKRELISGLSMGSGMVDERIRVYDYANGKLYELSDRFNYNYLPTIIDKGDPFRNTLCYVKYAEMSPEGETAEPVIEPLTMDILTEKDSADIW